MNIAAQQNSEAENRKSWSGFEQIQREIISAIVNLAAKWKSAKRDEDLYRKLQVSVQHFHDLVENDYLAENLSEEEFRKGMKRHRNLCYGILNSSPSPLLSDLPR